MGIIQKQAIRTTAISILGIGIGMFSNILKPLILSKEQIGAIGLLDTTSSLFATVFCLGFQQITFRMFPLFRNDKQGHGGYLLFGIILSFIGILLAVSTFILTDSWVLGDDASTKAVQMIAHFIIPMVFFRILFKNLDIYMSMLMNSVIGSFLQDFLLKFVILIGFIFMWLNWINYDYFVYIYVAAFCLPGLIIIIFSLVKTEKIVLPKRNLFEGERTKNMMRYGSYGIFASLASILVLAIDQLMINKMIGTKESGEYIVMFFAGSLVGVAARGVKRISYPILSEAWKNNDLKNITIVYKKSVETHTVVGLYIFIVGWAILLPALSLHPRYLAYSGGIMVFFFIGLAQLIDMMAGVNAEILATSRKYRLNVFFNLGLALLLIILNIFFINQWGIQGAAAASALAMLLINTIRWFYLYKTFGLQPFNADFFKIIGIGALLMILVPNVEIPLNPIAQIVVYLVSITLIYWSLVFYFNLSEDIKAWVLKMKRKFF